MSRQFNALNELHRELGRVFDDSATYGREPAFYATSNWSPQVDIMESTGEFTVHVDLPGTKANEVEVTLDKRILTIKGEKPSVSKVEGEQYKRQERNRGPFLRQFTLPELTDEEAINAKVRDGVLTISIPKSKKAKPLSISVQAH